MADVARLGVVVEASQIIAADQSLDRFARTAATTEQRVDRLRQSGVVASGSFNQLNSALRSLAVQATGVNPVMARLATTLGGFAIGSVMMTGILAGIAALAAGYRKLTEDSRNAREEAERLRGVLDKLGGFLPAGYALGAATGQAAADVSRLEADIAYQRAVADIRGGDSSILGWMAVTKVAQLEAELSEARGRLIAGQRAIQLDQRSRAPGAAPLGPWEDYGPPVPPWYVSPTSVRRNAPDSGIHLRYDHSPTVDMGMVERNGAILAARRNQLAGGGGLSGWDVAGAAASGAAGGGLGGAAMGLLSLAGPAGMIVSGVTSIVDGLFNQGERAREAARVWARAFEDFENYGITQTPFEREQQRLDRWRADLESAAVDKWKLAGPSADATRELRKEMERIAEQYDVNIERAREMAEKERDLADARFSALNAPTGFNAAYYGWRAGASFVPPSGGMPGVEVKVYVDGEEVATRIETRQDTRAKLGGGTVPTAR